MGVYEQARLAFRENGNTFPEGGEIDLCSNGTWYVRRELPNGRALFFHPIYGCNGQRTEWFEQSILSEIKTKEEK